MCAPLHCDRVQIFNTRAKRDSARSLHTHAMYICTNIATTPTTTQKQHTQLTAFIHYLMRRSTHMLMTAVFGESCAIQPALQPRMRTSTTSTTITNITTTTTTNTTNTTGTRKRAQCDRFARLDIPWALHHFVPFLAVVVPCGATRACSTALESPPHNATQTISGAVRCALTKKVKTNRPASQSRLIDATVSNVYNIFGVVVVVAQKKDLSHQNASDDRWSRKLVVNEKKEDQQLIHNTHTLRSQGIYIYRSEA